MINLGCDIDDVLLNTAPSIVSNLETLVDRKIDIDKITNFDISESTGIDIDIVKKAVKMTLESDYIHPIKNAVTVLNWLGTLYKPIYFISNKRPYLYKHNINIINKVGITCDYELYFCDKINDIPNKSDIILDHKINIFIEDRPETIYDIYEKTKCDILTFRQPWNRNIKFRDRIHIMYDWIDIRNYFINELKLKR